MAVHTSGQTFLRRYQGRGATRPVNYLLILAALLLVGGAILGMALRPDGSPGPAPSNVPAAADPTPDPIPTPTPGPTPAPTPTPTPTPEPTPEPTPPIDLTDWRLLLVNPWNPLPGEYEITLAKPDYWHQVDERCCDDLKEMLEACRAAGLDPLICAAYRTQEDQQELFDNKVRRLMKSGLDEETAVGEAGKVVAVPGTSEHQLGLAVDIVDVSNQMLDESQEKTAVQQWLMEHCWEYGWILRYPNEKSDITGIIYEPWHYRYVGREYSIAIRDSGLCLEEFLEQYQ